MSGTGTYRPPAGYTGPGPNYQPGYPNGRPDPSLFIPAPGAPIPGMGHGFKASSTAAAAPGGSGSAVALEEAPAKAPAPKETKAPAAGHAGRYRPPSAPYIQPPPVERLPPPPWLSESGSATTAHPKPPAPPAAPPPSTPTPIPPPQAGAEDEETMPPLVVPPAPKARANTAPPAAPPQPAAAPAHAAPQAFAVPATPSAQARPQAAPRPPSAPKVPARAEARTEPASGDAKGYRGGLFDNLDVPALTSFLVCGLLFFLAVVGVKSVDYSSLDKKTLEDIPERIAKIIMPMRPPGKPLPKPEEAGKKAGKSGAGKDPEKAAAQQADASAAARIERSRRTVTEQVAETQQRIQKAAVLSILSGKGPSTVGVTTSRARARGRSLVDFGGLDANLADLEGLTKFDSKLDANDGAGKGAKTRDDGVGAMAGIDKMVKGFQNAKVGAASKIGVMELEKPELLERNSRYTGDRSMADVGLFISKKQAMINLMYEEKLKVDPTLEGKITVVLVIEEDGTVSSATVLRSETTLNDPDFQADLLRRIKRWVFPPSTGGPVEMKSPFVFKPA